MAEVINMPRLSDTMEEGTVAKWLKKVGDKIEEGDILAEIETDKATMEFESFHEGTLLHIGIQEGEAAAVDSLLAIIGNEGEDISSLLGGGTPPAKEEVKEEATDSKEPGQTKAPSQTASIPEGVQVITMPRLSDTMEEGTVATWLKKVGDKIEEGDILAEIETDKATMEFESFHSGTLLYIGIEEGQGAPVDSLLAIIGPEGTNVDAVLSAESSGDGATVEPSTKSIEGESPKSGTADSREEPVGSRDGQRILASPLAKKIASERGIDLSQ